MAVNVGGNSENYQVRDVGDQVQRLIPSAKVVYTGEVGADPRNYRVKFDLLTKLFLILSSSTGWKRAWTSFIAKWWSMDSVKPTLKAIASCGSERSRADFTSSIEPENP